jgi:hypothetical protein
MNLRTTGLAMLMAALLGACAIGNKYDYDDSRAHLAYGGQGRRVAAAAWDQRAYVLSGHKRPNFVGLQRNRWGIPFDVGTASKQPLATEMTGSLVQSLAAAGFGAEPATVPPRGSENDAVQALLRGKTSRALLLRVDNWRSDTYNNPAVYYDLTLSVYGDDGRRLAAKTLRGRDNLKGRLLNPMGKAKQIVPETFRRKLEELLNAPEIAAALG